MALIVPCCPKCGEGKIILAPREVREIVQGNEGTVPVGCPSCTWIGKLEDVIWIPM